MHNGLAKKKDKSCVVFLFQLIHATNISINDRKKCHRRVDDKKILLYNPFEIDMRFYMHRNLNREFKELLRYFDLNLYGSPLVNWILTLLRHKHDNSLWDLLGIIIKQMSTSTAIKVLEESKDEFAYFEPMKAFVICENLLLGSDSPIAAAIWLSDYMNSLCKIDPGDINTWQHFADEFDEYAIDIISQYENIHLLSMKLILPTSFENKSCIELLLEYRRIIVIAHPRVQTVVKNMWNTWDCLNPEIQLGNEYIWL